jgi:hypothetical protein
LSRVEESATKSTYKLGVRFERCEKKSEKSAPKFVPSSKYHKEEEALKPTKTHYPSNPKPSFKPKREVKKETPKPREEAFVCMFYGCAGHLDEFCFRRKRIEKRHFDYTRNSYRDEFSDFLTHSFSRASPRTSSCTFSHFSHGPNHRLDALVTTYVLIMVIIFCVGPVFLLDGLALTLSRDTWTVHIFPVVAHIPLGQIVRCKRL